MSQPSIPKGRLPDGYHFLASRYCPARVCCPSQWSMPVARARRGAEVAASQRAKQFHSEWDRGCVHCLSDYWIFLLAALFIVACVFGLAWSQVSIVEADSVTPDVDFAKATCTVVAVEHLVSHYMRYHMHAYGFATIPRL
jgi:hypothetical protein